MKIIPRKSPPWVAGVLLLLGACSSTETREPYAQLKCWGSMHEVLREGRTHRRVRLVDVAGAGTWGVGALDELEGEITVVDGQVSLAIVENGELTHRALTERDGATLLLLASVDRWSEQVLPEVRTLADLEYVLQAAITGSTFDPSQGPVPVRIEGDFEHIKVHVLDHSCPIANPGGPPPWRWSGTGSSGTIVGIYAENQAGVLTHHGQSVHLHAVLQTEDGRHLSGHLDDVSLGAGVRLYLPLP